MKPYNEYECDQCNWRGYEPCPQHHPNTVSSVQSTSLLDLPCDNVVDVGIFVTAKLKGQIDPRQGWIIKTDPLKIQGQSGKIYECEGIPVVVLNPPNAESHEVVCPTCEGKGMGMDSSITHQEDSCPTCEDTGLIYPTTNISGGTPSAESDCSASDGGDK